MAIGAASRPSRPGEAPRAWQRMLSGRRLDLLDPSPFDIEIEDIAHGLARVARWNGQTTGNHAFSVAQHSLLVEEFTGIFAPASTPEERLGALLHDAPEYVIGDMISPFKSALGIDYRRFEERLEAAIRLRFGLPRAPTPRQKKVIKAADRASAWFEARRLAGFSEEETVQIFGAPPPGLDPDLTPLAAPAAQAAFLARFERLIGAIDASARTGSPAR